jgi:hypothetical protein
MAVFGPASREIRNEASTAFVMPSAPWPSEVAAASQWLVLSQTIDQSPEPQDVLACASVDIRAKGDAQTPRHVKIRAALQPPVPINSPRFQHCCSDARHHPAPDAHERRFLAGSSPALAPIVRQFMDKKLTADP